MSVPGTEPGSVGEYYAMKARAEQNERHALDSEFARRNPGCLSGLVIDAILFLAPLLFFAFASLLFSGYLLGHLALIRKVLSIFPAAWWLLEDGVTMTSPEEGVGYWATAGSIMLILYAGLTVVRFFTNRSLGHVPLLRLVVSLAVTLVRTCSVMVAIGLWVVTAAVIDRTVDDNPGGDLLAAPTVTVVCVSIAIIWFSLMSTIRSIDWRDRHDDNSYQD